MEPRDLLRVLRRTRRLAVVLAVIGAVAGGSAATLQPHRYSATARSFVSVASAQSLADLNSGAAFAQQAAKAYASVATTSYVLQPVIDRLKLADTPATLARRIQVIADSGSLMVDVVATDGDPALAAQVANSIAQQLSVARLALTPGAKSATTGSITITPVDPAVPSPNPTGLGWAMLALIGLLVGATTAFAIGLLRQVLDTRLRTRDDLARVTDLAVLGTTLRDARVARTPLVVSRTSTDARSEGYRTIRTNLRFLELDDRARSLLITSSVAGEGKSVTAANLALALAGLGRRVLLVDADLRRPRVAQYFGVDGAVGLTDVLIGAVDLAEAVQPFGDTGLHLLPAGAMPPNPNEQLQSRAMSALLRRVGAEYDSVVLDSPPLLPVSDALVLAPQVGAVVVVAASGQVRRPQLTEALRRLEQAGVRIAGLILTMAPRRGEEDRSYGYGPTPTPPRAPRSRRRVAVAGAAEVAAPTGATASTAMAEGFPAAAALPTQGRAAAATLPSSVARRPGGLDAPLSAGGSTGTTLLEASEPLPALPVLRQFSRPMLWPALDSRDAGDSASPGVAPAGDARSASVEPDESVPLAGPTTDEVTSGDAAPAETEVAARGRRFGLLGRLGRRPAKAGSGDAATAAPVSTVSLRPTARGRTFPRDVVHVLDRLLAQSAPQRESRPERVAEAAPEQEPRRPADEPGRHRRAAAKPVRVPPPPTLVARLHDRQPDNS